MACSHSIANTNTTSDVPGGPVALESKILETGAAIFQDFTPIKQICAHLNAFHTPADEPGPPVEANHYCAHVTDDVRQCLLYDSVGPQAKLIGVEYMITPKLFETLDSEERKLWHSHVFEVKSGMLVMPGGAATRAPGMQQAWETAETQEMRQVIELYGKVFHLWQVDQGHALPLGKPRLMTSYTEEGQFDMEKVTEERDARFYTDFRRKRELRRDIPAPQVHEDADHGWSRRNSI